ncbi:hypothetical protein DOTSEDRAFT_43534 [Dothistroma septosporum NZE10]|uniref:Peptidase M48 domain-containing protein n=1 Tax=Dothistroma septosporum (strain NZE10 / CBS 128990) TaxID=675120 RepID=N1PQC2_DOTSN|nr:hypothetical protein DOTSEDRAFT_43534 [Dothistroma septosporum NZE10]
MFTTSALSAFRPAFRLTCRSFTTTTPRSFISRPSIPFQQPRQRTHWQRTWQQSQKRTYRRGQPLSYQRFKQSQALFQAWRSRKTFYYEVAGIAFIVGGFYVYNLEPVPVSGRNRFNIVGRQTEQAMGGQMYQQTMQEFSGKLMSSLSKEHRQVQRVLNRLIPHSGLADEEWEIHVINDDMKNAFVIPGGKVFVFRGILDVCQGDDGLAAVLGHEIAHNVASHAAERMSQSFLVLPVVLLTSLFLGGDASIWQFVSQLAFIWPGSRTQEAEADYIGLLMMAESCYNPEAAVGLWVRMEKEEQGAPPQFLSTHPSSHNRVEKIRAWLPEAEVKYESGDCSTILPFANDFRQATNVTRL